MIYLKIYRRVRKSYEKKYLASLSQKKPPESLMKELEVDFGIMPKLSVNELVNFGQRTNLNLHIFINAIARNWKIF